MSQLVKLRDSDSFISLDQFETTNFGNPAKTISTSVQETDIDLQINSPFYPKAVNLLYTSVNNEDYVEIWLLDPNKNPLKKIVSNHYIASQSETIDLATTKDTIPKVVFRAGQYLRIAFQNVSKTPYTLNSNLDVWTATAQG